MKISCNIAEDLLPLYLDDACSTDSKEALEEHLAECSTCREKLNRMKTPDITVPTPPGSDVQLARYAKKVKRRRLWIGIFAVIFCIILAGVLSLVSLTLDDMRRAANPTVHDMGEGIYTLTANPFETTSTEAEQYVLFTNSTNIRVEVPENIDFEAEIQLIKADSGVLVGCHTVSSDKTDCQFSGLISIDLYRLKFPEGIDCPVIISDGTIVNFWHSLRNVVSGLLDSYHIPLWEHFR